MSVLQSKAVWMIILTLAMVAGLCAAEDDSWWPDLQLKEGDRLSVGMGVVLSPRPYKGTDTEVILIPLIEYDSEGFFARGKTLGYHFAKGEVSLFDLPLEWKFDGLADFRFDGYDPEDSSALGGMSDRDWTIDGGLSFSLSHEELGVLSLDWLADILDKHNGHQLRLAYEYPFVWKEARIAPGVGFAWQSQNLADYYFGVHSGEARAGRSAYSAGDTTNWFVRLRTTYDLNEEWTLFSLLTWEWYGNEIQDSPIVEDDSGFGAILGALYNF